MGGKQHVEDPIQGKKEAEQIGSGLEKKKKNHLLTTHLMGKRHKGSRIFLLMLVILLVPVVVWMISPHTVEFDGQGGDVPSMASLSVVYGQPYGTLATISREKHVFDGWWTGPGGAGKRITGESLALPGVGHVLYAKWFAPHVVLFNSAGGSAVQPVEDLLHGLTIPEPAAPTRAGYVFEGWYRESSLMNRWSFASDMVDSDMTLHARWNANTYTVRFDSQGGGAPSLSSKNVVFDQSYGPLAAATRSGYGFGGWWTGPGGTGVMVEPGTVVSTEGTQTLYAKWIPLHTVAFDSTGGSAVQPVVDMLHGLTIPEPAVPTRTGYAFEGWYRESSLMNQWSFAFDLMDSDMMLYAGWKANTYTVRFEGQGSSEPSMSSKSVVFGQSYGPLATVTRSGYGFAGWWTGPGGTGMMVEPGTMVKAEDGQTLYAKWIPLYTVDFNSAGGSAVQPVEDLLHGLTIPEPAAPTRAGYVFEGWYRESSLMNRWSFASDMVDSDMTLHARWNANTYTVRFDSQGGGAPSLSSKNVVFDQSYGPLATATRSGYGFGGWWTGPGGTGVMVEPGTAVSIDGGHALYAKWIPLHVVDFDSNGGSAVQPVADVLHGLTISEPAAPTRAGYVFEGWYRESGLVNRWNFSNDMLNTDMTLYAGWKANTYTVRFDSQGGSAPSVSSKSVAFGQSYGLLAKATRSGYGFGGWWTGPGGTGMMVEPGTMVKLEGGQTLYAKWIPLHTVDFDSTGGSAVQPVEDILHGLTISEPVVPTRTGYVFEGWYRESGLENRWEFASDTVDAHLILYARWNANTYTIRFDSQGGGTPSMARKSVDYGQPYGPLATVTRSGYEFYGWWTGPGGTGVIVEPETVVSTDSVHALYAGWDKIYSKTYTIGEKGPAEGNIFYDKGSYSDGWRYLEAAPVSTEWEDKVWGGYGTSVGGTSVAIGSGKGNTDKIVAKLGSGDYAAKLCSDLVHGGYSDWFLPSKDELNLMYTNLYKKNIGVFSDDSYWSSSEDFADNAYTQNFNNGAQYANYKSYEDRVRAVRAF